MTWCNATRPTTNIKSVDIFQELLRLCGFGQMRTCQFTKCPAVCSLDKTTGLTNPTSTLDKQTKVPGTYFQRGMLSCISNIYLHAILFNRCIALCDTGGHGTYDDTMTGFCQSMHRSSSISSPHHICDTGGQGRTGCCHQCTVPPHPCCHCDRICLPHEMVKRDNCTMPLGEWSNRMMFGATEDE